MVSPVIRMVLVGVLASLSTLTAAQNVDQQQAITDTLKQRLERTSGTIIDPQTAGYYQLVVNANGFARDALCPADDGERDALLKVGTDFFNWALRKKKNWGATASIFYNRASVDDDDATQKADAELKFFTVEQKGADPKKCNVNMVNVGTLYSPLLPIEPGIDPAPTHIELVTWYNDQSDQARIDLLPKLAGTLFGSVGLPPTLLDAAAAAVGTTPSAEIKQIIDTERTSKARTRLYPRQATDIGATAYLGLREPNSSQTLTTKAKAIFSMRPISSIFSPNELNFVSLAAKSPDEILNLNLASSGPPRYLHQLLAANDNYSQVLIATSYDVLSSRCDSLFLHLRDTLKLSGVDAAVIVYAIVAKHPSLKILSRVSCLKARAVQLAKVGITIPAEVIDVVETGASAKQPRMKEVMDSFAALRATDPQYVNGISWGAFRFPLTFYDAADRFGWDYQRKEFTVANRGDLYQLMRERIVRIGCWAYFEDPPISFATGMGDVPSGSLSPVRKSAALILLADNTVSLLQFRYGGGGEAAQVIGLAIVPRDNPVKEKMLLNENCKASNADRDWMQSFLQPIAVNAPQR